MRNEFVALDGDYWCHSKHSCTLINKDGTCGFKNGNCIDARKRDREHEKIFDKYEEQICGDS